MSAERSRLIESMNKALVYRYTQESGVRLIDSLV